MNSWDYIGLRDLTYPEIVRLEKCEDAMAEFVKRNAELLARMGLDINPDGDARDPNKPCRASFSCKCDCPKNRDGLYLMGEITVCARRGDSITKWEGVLLHELQHARDACFPPPKKNCDELWPVRSPDDRTYNDACKCANVLCDEFRAWQMNSPGRTEEEIARQVVNTGRYWEQGFGHTYCQRPVERRGYNLRQHRDRVASEMMRNCSAVGLIPVEQITFTQ